MEAKGGAKDSGSSQGASAPTPGAPEETKAGDSGPGVMQSISQRQSSSAQPQSSGAGGISDSDAAKITVNLTPSERDAIIKQYGFANAIDVTRKLNEIKNDRKGLRTLLDSFQKNFEETHKRKIRYTKDIVPVQAEFKRYKDLKVDIAKLEQVQKYYLQ